MEVITYVGSPKYMKAWKKRYVEVAPHWLSRKRDVEWDVRGKRVFQMMPFYNYVDNVDLFKKVVRRAKKAFNGHIVAFLLFPGKRVNPRALKEKYYELSRVARVPILFINTRSQASLKDLFNARVPFALDLGEASIELKEAFPKASKGTLVKALTKVIKRYLSNARMHGIGYIRVSPKCMNRKKSDKCAVLSVEDQVEALRKALRNVDFPLFIAYITREPFPLRVRMVKAIEALLRRGNEEYQGGEEEHREPRVLKEEGKRGKGNHKKHTRKRRKKVKQ